MKVLSTCCMGTGLFVSEAHTDSKISRNFTALSLRRAKSDTECLLRNCSRLSTSRALPRSQLGLRPIKSSASIPSCQPSSCLVAVCGSPCGPPQCRLKDDSIDRLISVRLLYTSKSCRVWWDQEADSAILAGCVSLTCARATIKSVLRVSASRPDPGTMLFSTSFIYSISFRNLRKTARGRLDNGKNVMLAKTHRGFLGSDVSLW